MEFNEEGKILCPDCKGKPTTKIVCPTCLGDKYLDWIELACGKKDGFGIGIDSEKKAIHIKTTGKKGGVTIQEFYNYLKEKWRDDEELIKYKFPMVKSGGHDIGCGLRTMDVYTIGNLADGVHFSNVVFEGIFDILIDLKLIEDKDEYI